MKCSVCHTDKVTKIPELEHSEMCDPCIEDLCIKSAENMGAAEQLIFPDEESFERFASAQTKRTED